MWTKALSLASPMLPTVVDCDDLQINTKNYMPQILKVLGPTDFARHIKNLFTLTRNLQPDVYEAFCKIVNDGSLDLNALSHWQARDLLEGFSINLVENNYDPEPIKTLLRIAFSDINSLDSKALANQQMRFI